MHKISKILISISFTITNFFYAEEYLTKPPIVPIYLDEPPSRKTNNNPIETFNLSANTYSPQEFYTKYTWPTIKPRVEPDDHGWFVNAAQLRLLLNNKQLLIVELGSWLGSSTRFILNHAQNATVIAVDHWLGSTEHYADSEFHIKLATLYETFLVNCWDYKHRLIPLRTTTLQGLEEIYIHNLHPDLVYVDASHDYDAVLSDLEKIYQLFPSTVIAGDDWMWNSVRAAVCDFASKYEFSIQASKNFWQLQK